MRTLSFELQRILTVLPFVLLPVPGFAAGPDDFVLTRERIVVEVGKGIYAIRHKDGPDTNPQGNTVVIVGDRGVLVIDSGYLPSSAREDIAQIRQWTDKPVRFLVNTHWHPDHIRGNAAYREAFPDIAIIAHPKTFELEKGFDEPNLVRYRARLAALKAQVESGKSADGKKLTAAERKDAATSLERRTAVAREFDGYVPAYPTVLVADQMNLDLGGRAVEIRNLGTGHTVGDLVVWVPEEKVLVSGDLIVYPVPYFFAGQPYDLIRALERIEAMDVRTIVPGHGPVLHDKAHLGRMLDLLRDTREKVVEEVRRRGSLSAKQEDVRKAIDFSAAEKQFAGDDADNLEYFRESMDGLVRGLFYQIDL